MARRIFEFWDDYKTIRTDYWVDSEGSPHGPYLSYYVSGNLKITCSYYKGKLQGEFKSLYEDGTIELHFYYNNGVFDGLYSRRWSCTENIFREWYSNGRRIDISIHGMDINNLSEDEMNFLKVVYGVTY